VARRGGRVGWGTASGEFERDLATQASDTVLAPQVWSESRRGRDSVRIAVTMTVIAADVGQALATGWWAFRRAAGDPDWWDLVTVAADVRYAGPLASLTHLAAAPRLACDLGESAVTVLNVAEAAPGKSS
jgi:hypothetical protein